MAVHQSAPAPAGATTTTAAPESRPSSTLKLARKVARTRGGLAHGDGAVEFVLIVGGGGVLVASRCHDARCAIAARRDDPLVAGEEFKVPRWQRACALAVVRPGVRSGRHGVMRACCCCCCCRPAGSTGHAASATAAFAAPSASSAATTISSSAFCASSAASASCSAGGAAEKPVPRLRLLRQRSRKVAHCRNVAAGAAVVRTAR